MREKPQTPSFRYVPGALLGQLQALQASAADVARTVTEVRGGQSGPLDAAAPFGAATSRVALSAAPLIDKYRRTLTAEVPFSGEDLCSDEAALRAATDIKAIADFIGGQAAELVTFYRGRLGARTRDVVTLFQGHLQNPFLEAALRPELAADCRPMLRHIETRNDLAQGKRKRSADLRGERDEAQAQAGALQEENARLRKGEGTAAPPLRAAPPAAPPRRGRSRRR